MDQECLDVNKRVDKLNVDRMADVADTHNKIALFGKSAQRHLDALRQFVIRECQNLFDLTTKTCSVVFDAVREVTMKMNVIWSICMANFVKISLLYIKNDIFMSNLRTTILMAAKIT